MSISVFKQPLAEEVWYTTYKWETDPTVIETFRREARALASIEKDPAKWEESYFDLLSTFEYVPGGRITSNAGTGLKGTSLVNCFVSGFRGQNQDSIDSIFDEIKRQAKILKSEGGYGFCANVLRPNGAYVRGIGSESPGAVTMLSIWDTVSKVITEGSSKRKHKDKGKNKIRKGAMMTTLSCWHPDVEDFVVAKQIPGNLTKFNMSVLVHDNFMEAVKNNLPWNLEFPDTEHPNYDLEWDGNLKEWKDKNYPTKVYKTYENANELWELITKSTYNRNEPGIIFIDRANWLNNLAYEMIYQATNPCVPAGTEILTDVGYVSIDKKIGEKINVWNGFEFSEVVPRVTGHDQSLVKVTLRSGQSLICTETHGWKLKDGSKIEAKDLKVGDQLPKFSFPVIESGEEIEDAYLRGFYCGDGSANRNEIWLYPPKYCCEEKLVKLGCNSHLMTTRDVKIISFKTDLSKIAIPFFGNLKSRLSWFAGLLDSDGTELIEGGVQVSSADRKFLISVQKLLTTMGVASSIGKPRAVENKMMPDGKGELKEYLCQEEHKLSLGAMATQLLKSKGLSCERLKLDKSPNRDSSQFIKIKSVESAGIAKVVYCFTEEKRNLGCFEGIVTSNCGEQLLEISGSCVLGATNLTQFLDRAKKDFDYDKLRKKIPILVRLQDAVNDVSNFPLPEQRDSAQKNRRVGIGYMGYGSALNILKMSYGSKEALEKTEKLASFITNEIYKASALLAKEKGSFPNFNKEKFLQSNFIKQALTEETIGYIKKHGLRNAFLTTCAPTGNTGIFANCVSGGLEPVIADKYIRTIIIQQPDSGLSRPKNINWDTEKCEDLNLWFWTKEGDEAILKTTYEGAVYKIDRSRGLTREEEVYDYSVLEMGDEYWNDKKTMGKDFYGKTIADLSVDDHINTMAVFAKYIDSSISKTINVPNDYPYEDFKDVYMKAYNTGVIKGITTYRWGTMTNVVSIKEEKKDSSGRPKTVMVNHAPKRPTSLPCDIHQTSIKGEKWAVVVGKLDGYPFEMFAGKLGDLKFAEKGTITKKKSKEYILESEGKEPLDLIATFGEHGTYVYSKMLSHGVPIWSIVDMCDKLLENVLGFNKAIGRVLKKYVNKEEVKFMKCSHCGSNDIVFQEGCLSCRSCLYSKCS